MVLLNVVPGFLNQTLGSPQKMDLLDNRNTCVKLTIIPEPKLKHLTNET